MRLPEETVADSFLPTFRFMLATELQSRGLKESKVAALLGLSQAAVSRYRTGKIKKEPMFLEDPATRKLVTELGEGLANGTVSKYQAMSMVIRLIRDHEARGLLCRLHEAEFSAIEGMGCSLCLVPRGGDAMEDEALLSNLRAALRLLEDTKGFPELIPNVGSNIGMARKNAADLKDVAAVPGRIYEMRGTVKIPAAPEFGASRHVAAIVLSVSMADSRVRAAMNIKYSEEVARAWTELGWKALEIGSEYEGRGTELSSKLSKRKSMPQIIYHLGGFGIEPQVYVIGESASNVVDRIKSLLAKLGH